LCRTETIGPVSFYALLRRFGSARAALEMVPQLARRGERSKTVTPVTRSDAETELTALQRRGASRPIRAGSRQSRTRRPS
jgi:DNA processing protein